MVQQRVRADQRLIHYENKLPLLKTNNEKYVRNQEKLRTAKMTFDEINSATYEKMKSLAQDKQKFMNPIVTRFLRLNLEFFRKNAAAFGEIKSMDIHSYEDQKKLKEQTDKLGHKDKDLDRMMVWHESDAQIRRSEANFDTEFSQHGNYNFDAKVYLKDVNTDY